MGWAVWGAATAAILVIFRVSKCEIDEKSCRIDCEFSRLSY